MKFDVVTFVIQILNFALLAYILHRVLYRPLKSIMDKRRRLVMESVDRAMVMKEDAVKLKERYEKMVSEFETYKVAEAERAVRDAEQTKKDIIDTARRDAAEEKQKAEAVIEYERAGMMEKIKEASAQISAQLAARLVEPLADEHMHAKLVKAMMAELEERPPARPAGARESVKAVVTSAYELTPVEMMELESLLSEHLGPGLAVEHKVDRGLMAGVRIWAGGQVLDGSIAGQLAYFRERALKGMG